MRDVPDIGGLELLSAVVRRGSISAAARELGVAQQSASTRLRAIERELGIELFQRTPRGVVPTAAGDLVASWAEEILAAAHRFRVGVETVRDERRRELTIAASQTVSAHLLPRWLVDLRGAQLASGRVPTLVRMVTANSVEVEALLREGRADLGFIESPRLPEGLSHTVVGEDPLVLIVAPGHPWARKDGVSFAVVADTGLVAREEGSGTRTTWEDAVRTRLRRDAAPPAVVLPTSAAVRSAVAEGLAPALLSRRAVADDLRLGRLVEVPLAGAPVSRPISALWRGTDRDLGPTSRELIAVAAGAGGR